MKDPRHAGIICVFAASAAAMLVCESGSAAVHGDFNGDGRDDLVIGVPHDSETGLVNSGAVNVIYGSGSGLRASGDQLWTQDSPGVLDFAEAGEGFGTAVAVGDFDGDGFDDLAIGVPYQTINGQSAAGAVNVLYGSSNGLTATGDQFWHQDVAGIQGACEADDTFGAHLATGDFDGDGFDDLAVSIPHDTVNGLTAAGSVCIIYGSASGLTASGDQLWHQDVAGIAGTAEQNEYFGDVIATGDFDGDGFSDLVVGVYYEDVNPGDDAGAVNVIFGSPSGLTASGDQYWTQDSPGIKNVAEPGDYWGWSLASGDFDGDGFDDLAVGSANESISGLPSAGAVNVLYGSASGLKATGNQFWHQNIAGVMGSVQTGDSFANALAAGDFDGDGFADLAIGIPGETVGGLANAGAVAILYGSASGLTASGDQLWNQNSSSILDVAEATDFFGESLTVGDFDGDGRDDLVIGVSNEAIGGLSDAGAVNVLYGSGAGLSGSGDQFWHQDVTGINGAAGMADHFGFALAP